MTGKKNVTVNILFSSSLKLNRVEVNSTRRNRHDVSKDSLDTR
jgi:hypothetical protein